MRPGQRDGGVHSVRAAYYCCPGGVVVNIASSHISLASSNHVPVPFLLYV